MFLDALPNICQVTSCIQWFTVMISLIHIRTLDVILNKIHINYNKQNHLSVWCYKSFELHFVTKCMGTSWNVHFISSDIFTGFSLPPEKHKDHMTSHGQLTSSGAGHMVGQVTSSSSNLSDLSSSQSASSIKQRPPEKGTRKILWDPWNNCGTMLYFIHAQCFTETRIEMLSRISKLSYPSFQLTCCI